MISLPTAARLTLPGVGCVFLAVNAAAQQPLPFGQGRPAARQPRPWDNDALLYSVTDTGLSTFLTSFPRAGVPTLARMKDGRLIAAHQYFPAGDPENFDKVAVLFSSDEGKNWSAPRIVRMEGLPPDQRFPFDPTLVPLPDGRVRLYFTSVKLRTPEAIPAIHSGISKDGVNYQYEPGVRFGIENRPVIDCAVVLHQGVFHLYSPDNGAGAVTPNANTPGGSAYHATSKDGLRFTRADDLRVGSQQRWLGAAHSDGQRIMFAGTAESRTPGGSGIWFGSSADGFQWRMESSPVLHGADPGAVPTCGNGWLLLVTGPPRSVAPNAQPPR